MGKKIGPPERIKKIVFIIILKKILESLRKIGECKGNLKRFRRDFWKNCEKNKRKSLE